MPPEIVGLAEDKLIQSFLSFFFFQFAFLDGVMSYHVAAPIPTQRFSGIGLKS